MILNNLNPLFQTTFLIKYTFGQVQNYRFLIYDIDN